MNIVRFASKENNSFIDTVNEKVQDYFNVTATSPYANSGMWQKTIVMILCYFIPYIFLITGFGANNLLLFFCAGNNEARHGRGWNLYNA